MTAPNFCMLLRKHIGNGRIVEISQPKLELAPWHSLSFLIYKLEVIIIPTSPDCPKYDLEINLKTGKQNMSDFEFRKS